MFESGPSNSNSTAKATGSPVTVFSFPSGEANSNGPLVGSGSFFNFKDFPSLANAAKDPKNKKMNANNLKSVRVIRVGNSGKGMKNPTIIKPTRPLKLKLKGKRSIAPAADAREAKIAHQSGVLDDGHPDTDVVKTGVTDANVNLILTDNVFDNSSNGEVDEKTNVDDGDTVIEKDVVKNSGTGDTGMEEDCQEEHQSAGVKKDVTASADPDAHISKQTFEGPPPGGGVKKDLPVVDSNAIASDDMPP